jgi:hypothetical protein
LSQPIPDAGEYGCAFTSHLEVRGGILGQGSATIGFGMRIAL